jgi:hypothetical protein
MANLLESQSNLEFGKLMGILISGHKGSFYEIDRATYNGRQIFLMESELFGDDAPCVIIDEFGNILMEDVHNGWSDFYWEDNNIGN